MKSLNLLLLTFVSSALAYDSYFTNSTRAEIFDKTDLKVSDLTINFSEEDFKNYFLSYQCLHDTNIRYQVENEECYTAPWVNLDAILEGAVKKSLISKSNIAEEDLQLIDKKNITLSEFDYLFTTYTNYTTKDLLSTPNSYYTIPLFETENAGLTLNVDGETNTASKIKFTIGGKYTKVFEKLGFNIKIKKGSFLERKQLRLRTEAVDPSFLREKLAYDICNVVGLPSLSANYVRVFFNEKYMGLYVLRDAFKSQWIEYTFGEKSTTHLYTCDRSYGDNSYFNCINDDENIVDDQDWEEFLKRLARTKTREELEEFFDVKTYIKWQALKYLFGSWDHVTNAHNQVLYMYHDTSAGRDIWIPLLYDFDSEFGAYKDIKTHRSFEEESLELPNPLYKILQLNDKNEELISYIDEFMRKAFNPKDLFARIDQLKEFLSPYVKEDRTPGDDGRLPGRVKRVGMKIEDYFTYEDYDGNSEYTMIKLHKYSSDTIVNTDRIMGLKQWILERFQFACEYYNLDCRYASEYLDGYEYETDVIEHDEKQGGCQNSGYPCCLTTTKLVTSDAVGDWGIENNDWCLFEIPFKKDECWSLAQGYECCKKKTTTVYYVTPNTDEEWGVEDGQWCGITDLQRCPSYGDYKCCDTCNVYYTDDEYWGVEHGNWCSIRYSCNIDHPEDPKSTETVEPDTTTMIESTETIEPDTTTMIESTETIEPDTTTMIESTETVEPDTTTMIESTETVEPDSTTIIESTETIEPTVTIEPTESAETSVTIEPTESAETTVTIEPTETIEPTVTIEPTESTETTVTIEPTETIESTITVEPTETVETTETVEIKETIESTEIIESTITVEPTEIIESTITVEPTETIESTITVEPTETIESTITVEPTETVEITETLTKVETTEITTSTPVSDEVETSDVEDISSDEEEEEENLEEDTEVNELSDIEEDDVIIEDEEESEEDTDAEAKTVTITSTLVKPMILTTTEITVPTSLGEKEEDDDIILDLEDEVTDIESVLFSDDEVFEDAEGSESDLE